MNNTFKTTLIGTTTTGKTSLVIRLKNKIFINESNCTIGASFMKLTNENVNYELWDTAGQERFFALLPMYFRGTRIFIYVFDLSQEHTISAIDRYYKDLNLIQNYKIIIVGNKSDLVTQDDIKNIDHKIRKKFNDSVIADKIIDYIYVSAKTGENCDILLSEMNLCAKELGAPIRTGRILDMPVKIDNEVQKSRCSC